MTISNNSIIFIVGSQPNEYYSTLLMVTMRTYLIQGAFFMEEYMNETMTIKQMYEMAGVSRQTVTRAIRKLYPELIKNGITTKLNKDQSVCILKELRIKELPNLPKESIVESNLSNGEQVKIGLRIEKLEQMFITVMEQQQQTNKIMLQMISKQPEQLQLPEQEKMTVKEYCITKNIASYNPKRFMQSMGRFATNISKELNRSIKYVNEGEYNKIGSYDLDMLNHAYELAKIEDDKTANLFNMR